MATYSGTLAPSVQHTIGGLRPSFYAAPIPLNAPNGWLTANALVGTRTNTQPVTENPKSATGYGAFNAGYGGVFYNRIQITPSTIDFGNLLTAQSRPVELWNGYLQAVDVEGLVASNNEGLLLSSTFSIPGTLAPLQAVAYTLTADTIGPNEIEAVYQWGIDGETYELFVFGSRIVVFPFLPNWEDGFDENLEWMTTVERAYAGDEQRVRLRNAPRKRLQYPLVLRSAHDSSRLESMLFGWQSRNFAVPFASERSRLTAGAAPGSLTVSLDTTDLGYYAGQVILLYANSETYEAVEVDAVSSSSLELVRPLGNSWPVNTAVYPLGLGHLANQVSLDRQTDHYITADPEFRFLPNDANAFIPTSAISTTHRGYEVFLDTPDWSETPNFTYEDAFVTFGDDGIGLLEFSQTSDFPMIIRKHRWVMKTRAAIKAFRAFIGRRAGRLAPVFIPSWNTDFYMAENAASSSSTLVVRDNGYRAFVNAHTARRDIAIFLRNQSSPILREVLGTADNGNGTTNLLLNAPLGVSFTPDDVRRISHLNLYRMGSDTLTLQWLTSKVAAATINWVLVKG